jgi:hypothetical protein
VHIRCSDEKQGKNMRLGYRINEDGAEVVGTTRIETTIREMAVELYVDKNADVSYPLSSPHNKGFHVKIHGTSEAFFTEMNINDVTEKEQLIKAVISRFDCPDIYVMISSGNANSGDTFNYDSQVYNRTAIDNKSYNNWDEDLEELEDNADKVVTVFLNDHLRWEVV